MKIYYRQYNIHIFKKSKHIIIRWILQWLDCLRNCIIHDSHYANHCAVGRCFLSVNLVKMSAWLLEKWNSDAPSAWNKAGALIYSVRQNLPWENRWQVLRITPVPFGPNWLTGQKHWKTAFAVPAWGSGTSSRQSDWRSWYFADGPGQIDHLSTEKEGQKALLQFRMNKPVRAVRDWILFEPWRAPS